MVDFSYTGCWRREWLGIFRCAYAKSLKFFAQSNKTDEVGHVLAYAWYIEDKLRAHGPFHALIPGKIRHVLAKISRGF